ncbi:MAG TPA: amidohydrolase family protein [Bryobacteraceae bacterium]|nr:amidohydrolase family protein [Bryobacteraceae bacterium]
MTNRAIAALLLLLSAAYSQNRPLVLKAARMFDGHGISTPGLVVVSGTTILAVGAGSPIPAGAQVIDFGDATLSPGFIDAHTHLSFPWTNDYRQEELDRLQKPIPEQTLIATENLKKTLHVGITTARDVGSGDFIDVGLRNAVRAGIIVGPRMLVAVHALGATGGHCDDQGGFRYGIFGHESGPEDGIINSPDEARRAVRLNVKYGADVIKTCATGGVLSLTDDVDTPQLTQAELNALVDEAHALRKKTAAHAHGAEGAKRAIRAGIDSIEHGTFLDDEALDMMKARGTVLIPTLMATQGGREKLGKGMYPPPIETKMRAAIEAINQTMRRALAKGVRIGMGTDAAVYPHGRNTEEFHMLVDLGMQPLDALRAGTSLDAELLGLQNRIGTLEPGKLADIIAIPGDPTQNIRQCERVFFVMKEGAIYRNDQNR